jgi:flagellar protein FliO/FliZ
MLTDSLPAAAPGGSGSAPPVPGDLILNPTGASSASLDLPTATTPGALLVVVALLLAAVGAWLWLRLKNPGAWGPRRVTPRLGIEETRSLGHKQFLVVATYREQRFLLGVCPGSIRLLAPLEQPQGAVPEDDE